MAAGGTRRAFRLAIKSPELPKEAVAHTTAPCSWLPRTPTSGSDKWADSVSNTSEASPLRQEENRRGRRLRRRSRIEGWIGGAAAVFAVVTVLWRDWMEVVFRVDPDHGNGSFEWLVVGVLFGLALVLAASARYDWRRSVIPIGMGT
jgi:hypothetical protein